MGRKAVHAREEIEKERSLGKEKSHDHGKTRGKRQIRRKKKGKGSNPEWLERRIGEGRRKTRQGS